MAYYKTFKPKPKKISTLRNKADRLLQEVGRKTYDCCMVCGGEYSCLHHYWPKSKSTVLRYDLSNCVPICAGCHLGHHTGNPSVHREVERIRGKGWADRLEFKKNNTYIKVNKGYYLDIIEKLEKLA